MTKTLLRWAIQPVLMICLCSSASAFEGTLVVANRAGGSISLIDLETGLEVARVPVGPIIPHEVAVSADGRFALTGEYGPNDSPGRHVILIDIPNARIVGRIDLGENSRPHTAVFLPDGQRAVATMQDSDQIALIDLGTMAVVRTYPTGGREGHMVRLSPDGSRAYVTSRLAEGTLSVIFLDEDRPPCRCPLARACVVAIPSASWWQSAATRSACSAAPQCCGAITRWCRSRPGCRCRPTCSRRSSVRK